MTTPPSEKLKNAIWLLYTASKMLTEKLRGPVINDSDYIEEMHDLRVKLEREQRNFWAEWPIKDKK